MKAQSPDRDRAPRVDSPRAFALPAFERHRLDNGLEVLLARHGSEPLCRLTFLTRGGAGAAPVERPGAMALSAALLDEGSTRRSGPEIAAWVERLGGSLGSSADWNALSIGAAVLSRHLEQGLELVADAALTPTFPEHEVERLRQRTLGELLRRGDQPAALADDALADELYRDTPYGFPLPGTPPAVSAVSRDELIALWREASVPSRSALVLSGHFDVTAALATISAAFASWPARPSSDRPPIRPAARQEVTIRIVDRPEAAQTELRVGHVGVPRQDPDRPALTVLNCLLGGKFTSRLNLSLRERHGVTYGVSSRFVERRGPGPFVVGTAVATPAVGLAVGEIVTELQRLRQERIPATEIRDAIDYLVGVFPYTVQSASDLLHRLEELAVFELEDDAFARWFEALSAVDADELRRVAELHLHPEQLAIVAVGPAHELREQLQPFGRFVESA